MAGDVAPLVRSLHASMEPEFGSPAPMSKAEHQSYNSRAGKGATGQSLELTGQSAQPNG